MEEKKEKTAGELRREELFLNQKNGYDRITPEEEAAMRNYCDDYKRFLDNGKTERECVEYTVRLAEEMGFCRFERGMAVKPGDKIYRINRGKAVMLAVIGSAPLSEGVNIGAAHIDSPRLDLKPNPLYEDSELAFFSSVSACLPGSRSPVAPRSNGWRPGRRHLVPCFPASSG
jgi:hypothetical protein